MPFVIRKIEPRYVSRGHVPQGKASQDWPVGAELEAVANGTLTASLKQLASLLTAAEDIFADLTAELTAVADRSGKLRQRLDKVEEQLSNTDPKKIPVPESDMSTFALRTEHFKSWNKPVTSLFTSNTRPKALKELYEAAAIVAVKSLDSLRRDQDGSSMDMFLCTPVLGKRRRDQSLDIESRVPAAIEDLRRWTSTEALGDVTVPPDCMSRILGDTTDDSAVDHKLPSPEEQVQAVALKFPAEIVAVDVSGRGFYRMSMRRRSLLSGPGTQETAVKRRSRPRRPRGKRRNTIAGTDQKEIRQAIEGETTVDEPEDIAGPSRAHRSASTDILGSSKKHSPLEKKSHFNTLKAWGISRLKLISPKNSQSAQQLQQPEADAGSLSPDRTAEGQTFLPEETNIYETVTTRRRKDKSHERKPSSSSSSGKSTSSIPVSVPSSDKQLSVKLRESAAQRRERRKGSGRDDAPHSSSGNWSASSESGRASIGSETTTTTHQPRSTTTASVGTSSTSLCHVRRFKGRDTSASSSVTSEGTLTPDIIHDIGPVPFSDDGETSSVYSCDTEGYYTSFHMDSGLKTLREEEILPQSPLVRSCNLDSDPTSPVVENEYELFGRGSTSTTTSSAGTVCTALLAPPPPERKSSLTVVAMVHGQNKPGGESPDSGHNTSSSPVESASSPACTGRSYSEFEYSESSDLEGCDRIERIRSKTAINTSRIPSMCVITPPGSDDEHAKDRDKNNQENNESPGSVLMSATVGTSKMEVINGQDKNLYATVQTVLPSPEQKAPVQSSTSTKVSPLSGVLEKLRGVLPLTGKKHQQKANIQELANLDSGDYVTIADVRNNNNKLPDSTLTIRAPVTYANADLFKKDAEYVSLSELPKKPDSSLERKRQGARVTLDSEGKVVYSSDSLRRRKGAHTTFNPGPFVKEGVSPSPSPLLHRAHINVRAVNRTTDSVDGNIKSSPPTSPQLGKVIIRAAKSPDRAASPDYIRTPSTVVSPTCPTSPHKQLRGAYVNVQGDEDNTVLPIAGDSLPVQVIVQQPPPYIGPPQPHDMRKAQSYEDFANDSKAQTLFYSQQCPKRIYDNRSNYYQQQQPVVYHQQTYIEDPKHYQVYDQNSQYDQQHIPQNYAENQMLYNQRVVQAQNARNQQFFTLPNRRSQRDNEPPRSVTPDITRGLGRGPVSSMHMLARQGQNSTMEQMGYHGQMESDAYMDLNRRHVELEARSRLLHQQQQQQQQRNLSVDVKNRFAAPQGLSALGYRSFASSPVQPLDRRSPSNESLKRTPISPIGPEHNNGFKSSTPTARSTPTVAERLALTTKSPSTKVSTSGRSTPVSGSSSGRNTPTNLVISPTRSTMSNEELFAAIHKSKKRLNIREDSENLSPSGSMNSLVKNNAGTRHSWSPESQKVPEIPPTVQVPSTTSRLDFKRLLLQQSVKTGPTRLSAAEQLKLSRQQCQLQQSPQNSPLSPLSKVLSPRSAWRFQTPRTDVLSSTIIEDTAAEEKAMKPSPENTMPSAKSRRQLDLCKQKENQETQNENRFSTKLMKELNNASDMRTQNPQTKIETTSENRTEFRTDNRVVIPQISEDRVPPLHSQSTMLNSREEAKDSCPKTSAQTRSSHDAISAFESRRLSNQLAKAQFLASGIPVGQNPNQNPVLQKRFRARSESPQHAIAQNVTRSPSAPTLETAL